MYGGSGFSIKYLPKCLFPIVRDLKRCSEMESLLCIYCGQSVRLSRRARGEHIIPESIGGARTIRCVCNACNVDFSKQDKALVSDSYLSISARRYMAKKLGRCWEVDHSAGNLLLEAQPATDFRHVKLWPQLIFGRGQPQMRGDFEEFEQSDADEPHRVFLEHLHRAYLRHRSLRPDQRSPLIFEQVKSLLPECIYPPRVYAEREIADFHPKMHFKCRYSTPEDRTLLLESIQECTPNWEFNKMESVLGSGRVSISFNFDVSLVLRALTKIGINLLADVCTNTIVDRFSFREAVRFVKYGISRNSRRMIARYGFVRHGDLKLLNCAPNFHKFRLVHFGASHLWAVYSSFFGGDINTMVEFEGPSDERWSTVDITVPLNSKEWKIRKYQEVKDLQVRACLEDIDAILPSLPPGSVTQSSLRVVTRSVRR